MASVILLFLLTLSSPLFFGQTLKPVEAGDKLIESACHTAEVPVVCMQCVKSDERSGKADAVGIANIIIDCLMSHSSYLASNMSNLASNPEHNATKSAYEHCFLHCSDAKTALNSAALELKNGSYDSAELSLREAALYQGTCRYEFVSSNETYVPPNVYYDLKVFDILTVAAFRIIEKL
ncbi:uncharacterized protein LOC117908355 [Vitis riparia]|uniref:uncharacterized protein LOC117908355 n=1 Tax=Vitis riparia TaxID=96939 RepID=UPI00155A0B94|nr:uncharacterized protein LOC117908355 [Vitis riparia]